MTIGNSEPRQTGAKLNPETYRRVRALALLQGRTVGELIDEACVAYLAATEANANTVATRTKASRPKRG